MIRFKIIDNRTNVSKKIKEEEEKLINYRNFFLEGVAKELVLRSPVDTGTYIKSHQITTNRGGRGNFSTSKGKARGQPYTPNANEGLSSLYSDINSLPKNLTLSGLTVSNYSTHANEVEYKHGYAPYTTVRNKANIIADKAAQRAKAL